VGYKRGWRIEQGLNFLVGLLTVQFAYIILQRYLGIDWVHGWEAKLGAHRYSYGVYRVSGFMGHPLSFAYNLMLLSLFAYFHAFKNPDNLAQVAKKWRTTFALTAMSLVLTGSRAPLIFMLGIVVLAEFRRILNHKKVFVVCFAFVLGIIAWEKSTILRFNEVISSESKIEEKMPRIVFWKVHWEMFEDHPWMGVGYHDRKMGSLDYYKNAGYTEDDKKYRAHNIYLQTLADSGMLGFVGIMFFLGGLAICARTIYRNHRNSILYLLLAGVLLSGLVQNNLRDSEFLYALAMLCAVTLASVNKDHFDDAGRKNLENLQS
jgi:O-antigen ligase